MSIKGSRKKGGRKPDPGRARAKKSGKPHGQKKGDPDYEGEFLQALARGYSVTRACEISSLGFSTVHFWRSRDPEFRARWDAALSQGSGFLEDVARDRAVATSDRLLMFLLSGRMPEKYGRSASMVVDENNGSSVTIIMNPVRPGDPLPSEEVFPLSELKTITSE